MQGQEEIFINEAADVVYLPELDMVATIAKTDMPKAPSSPATKTDASNSQDGMAIWGDDNKEPFRIIEEVEKNAALAQAIYWKSNAITSGGLAYGSIVIDPETGESKLKRVIDPRVEQFLRRSNIPRFLREAAHEFYKFWNVWPELIVSNDRAEIASIACHESAFCRWGVQNTKGLIDRCYINANWDKDAKVGDATTIKIDVVDVYYDPVNTVRSNTKLTNFIYPLAGTSSGRTYYQRAPWMSILSQGWLKLANRVPVVKNAIMDNQMKVKYQLSIAEWWWQWKYSDWDDKKELRRQRMTDELNSFTEKMKGDKNAGNSLLTAKRIIGEKEYEGWTIKAIDEKQPANQLIEDGQEATGQILFSQGVDPTLIGAMPGKKMGTGGGSDKRVAHNIFIANSKPEQDIILEPLAFIFDYNGYRDETGQPYTIWFQNYWITTLDKGKESQQQSS